MKTLMLLVLALASAFTLFGSLDARALWHADVASFEVPVLLPSGEGDGGRDDDEEDEEERRLQPAFGGGIRLVDPDVAAALN